jgi:hypothetical protein
MTAFPETPGARWRPIGRSSRLAALTLLALALSACGGAAAGSSDAAAIATSSPAASGAASQSPSAATTVSANSASEAELVAALESAGVPNAARWAREIMEYRPYDSSDPTLQHLQDELAKYNPDSATLHGILSVLRP